RKSNKSRIRHPEDLLLLAAYARPFGRAEKVQLVFLDGPAHRVAKLVACKSAFGEPVGVVVRSIGSQGRDTVEFIPSPMEGVGAGLGGYVHYSATGASILGGVVAGQYAEFLHGIQRNILADAGSEDVHVFPAVDEQIGAGGAPAVDGHPPASA